MAPLVINNHELAEELSAVNVGIAWELNNLGELGAANYTFQFDHYLGSYEFEFDIINKISTPLNVYYSNYSALYYIDGEYYVLPPNVYYLNYS